MKKTMNTIKEAWRAAPLAQQVVGAILTGIGILIPVLGEDVTAALLFVPFGLYILLTRENVLYVHQDDV